MWSQCVEAMEVPDNGTKNGHTGTISSVNISSHVTSSRVCNRSDINFAIPRAHYMGTKYEGGDSASVAGKLLQFFGINDGQQMEDGETFLILGEIFLLLDVLKAS